MADITLLLFGAIALVSVMLLLLTFLRRKREVADPEPQEAQRPRGDPVARAGGDAGPRRAGRNVRTRMRVSAARMEEEYEDDPLAEEIALPEGKIGAKKRKKLELKAEKRMQRERELEEREERKQREQELEERRKREEEREKEERLKKEEEERAQKEQQERQEYEEYLKLKETFAVEEEGFDENENVEESHMFNDFINYIKKEKVVLLEDLAAHFKMKTQDTIDRVQELLAQELLAGVIDDRGKFIYITKEELEAVALFIKQRGRVSISELAECSNTLISLQPEGAESVTVSS